MSYSFEGEPVLVKLQASQILFAVLAVQRFRWLLACHSEHQLGDASRAWLAEMQAEALAWASAQVERQLEEIDELALAAVFDATFADFHAQRCKKDDLGERASGDAACPVCLARFRDHPYARERYLLAHNGDPVLHRLCDGTLVKL